MFIWRGDAKYCQKRLEFHKSFLFVGIEYWGFVGDNKREGNIGGTEERGQVEREKIKEVSLL